ncbi:hypothetical protein SMC26_22810 [Actinomadura fulvescens]|uniref:Uncharacterized protein n=1 Tax=Actinomadura fulvescens TaxID=46160 RepID=A0ABN3QNR3_9ACTN
MLIEIRIDWDAPEREMRSLQQWLSDERYIRRNARMTWGRQPSPPDHMGSAPEMIKLLVDTGFQVSSLVVAIASWRATRPRKATITIERDGVKVEATDGDPEQIERVMRLLDGDRP